MTSSEDASRAKVTLAGVSETALLTLNARAAEARRPDALIDDPMAVELVDSIQFDFAKFGRTGQDIALRARAFDIKRSSTCVSTRRRPWWPWPRACRPASGVWTPRSRTASFVG